MSEIYRINLAIDTEDTSRLDRHRRQSVQARDLLTDPLILIVATLAVLVMGWISWTEFQTTRQHTDLLAEVATALRDSTRLDEDIYLADNLRRRKEAIETQMDVIRSIDQGRYVWAHLMDEFAVATPPDLWLTEWEETGPAPDGTGNIAFEIIGLASGTTVLSDFIRALEASPFIADVSFTNSRQRQLAGQDVTEFTVRGVSEDPDPTILEMERIGVDGRERDADPPEGPGIADGLDEGAVVPLLPEAESIPSPTGSDVR